MKFKDYLNETYNSLNGYKKIIVHELNSVFDDMETTKGRWFARNAPKKIN